ncbi:MAG TPA: hypothetical protein VLM05_07015 [Mycobacteriales bacterium]|nr:hypothetical protein [Mycobacteriales bacterium]
MQRLVAGGVVRAVVVVGVAWALLPRDPGRRAAVGAILLVLTAERWRNRAPVVINAGVVAMSGGTVTVGGNAIGFQDPLDGDRSER